VVERSEGQGKYRHPGEAAKWREGTAGRSRTGGRKHLAEKGPRKGLTTRESHDPAARQPGRDASSERTLERCPPQRGGHGGLGPPIQ
jgi:hypothetical protein